jgi:hypothetical protein
VSLSNTFQNYHDRFTREGKIHSVINPAYKRALADSILYYESGKWISRGGTDGATTARRDRRVKKK